MDKLIENLNAFERQVAETLEECGRSGERIEIVAAGKFRSPETLSELYATGRISAIGENRVQEFNEKYTPEMVWDIIGRLQTNKVKYVVGKVRYIQSLDRLNLADEIERVAAKRGVVQKCLIEINTGEEEAKGGIVAGELDKFLISLEKYPHISVCGVMAVAPRGVGEEALTECFSKARDAFEKAKRGRADFDVLSMGMSEDFRLALKCGANMLRPGRILFE